MKDKAMRKKKHGLTASSGDSTNCNFMRTSVLIVAATLLAVVPVKAQILKRPELFVDSEHVAGISANGHQLWPGESMVFDANETVVLTAYEGDDFYGWFERWSGDVGGMTSQNPITIVMDSDKFITAHYSFGNAGEEYYLSSLSITPGVANVTSATQTLSFQIDYTSMQGGQPSGWVTLRPPSPLVSPVVVDLSLTTHTLDEWGLGGTFSFSREFPTGTLSGQWTVDVVLEEGGAESKTATPLRVRSRFKTMRSGAPPRTRWSRTR